MVELVSKKTGMVPQNLKDLWDNCSEDNLLKISIYTLSAFLVVNIIYSWILGSIALMYFSFGVIVVEVLCYFVYKKTNIPNAISLFLVVSSIAFSTFSILYGGEAMTFTFLINILLINCFLNKNISQRKFFAWFFLSCELLMAYSFFYLEPFYPLQEQAAYVPVFTAGNIIYQFFLIGYVSRLLERRYKVLRQTKNSLQKSIAKSYATLESTRNGIAFIDYDGKIGQFNQLFTEIWKIDIVNPNENDFLCGVVDIGKNPGEFIQLYRKIELEKKATASGEIEFHNGRIISYTTKPHSVDGVLTGRVWTFDDITKERTAARELETNETLFRGFFEHAPVGIVVTEGVEKIKYVNHKFMSLLGYNQEEMYQLKISDIVPAEYLKNRAKRYAKLVSGAQKSAEFEIDFIRKDGSLMPVRLTVSLIRNVEGEIIQDMVIVQDLTEKKAIEVALAKSESQLINIFEHVPFPLFLFRKDQIIDSNQPALKLLGIKTKEVLRKTSLKQLMPIVQDDGRLSVEVFKEMSDKARALGSHSFEWVITDIKGNNRIVLFTLTQYEVDGEEIFFAIWNDLTQQKNGEEKINQLMDKLTNHNRQLEEEIERRMIHQKEINLELKRSNIDLQQFAYVASHDLQEPLRMIGNFIQLLERKYGERLEDDGRQFISFAVDGVNRMSKLIKNLLEFSQVGHQNRDFEPADLNEIVNNKVLDLYQRIVEKKACIDMHLLPESVNCVPDQLGIVFYNLIANGIKFNESSSPRVVVTNQERASEWLFIVRDNGIGINPSYADKIFQIFQRLHRRESYEGTGIGLSLCKKIINRHKGRIWFESKTGEGTTFYFTISKSLLCEKEEV